MNVEKYLLGDECLKIENKKHLPHFHIKNTSSFVRLPDFKIYSFVNRLRNSGTWFLRRGLEAFRFTNSNFRI